MLTDCLAALGFRGFTTQLNHRQILAAMARVSGLDEASAAGVYRALDKLDKIGPDGVRAELEKNGVNSEQAERILALALLEGSPNDVLEALSEGLAGDERGLQALENLRAILAGLHEMGVPEDTYAVAPRLARGLSYYTGCVFEVLDADRSIGSLLGGGRYDELIGQFAGRALPTVGLALGIERLHDLMTERGMGPQQRTTAPFFVTLFPDNAGPCLALARELRAAGLNVATALDATQKLGRQFQEADRKGARFVIVLGPDELAQGVFKLKTLADGSERTVSRERLVAELKPV